MHITKLNIKPPIASNMVGMHSKPSMWHNQSSESKQIYDTKDSPSPVFYLKVIIKNRKNLIKSVNSIWKIVRKITRMPAMHICRHIHMKRERMREKQTSLEQLNKYIKMHKSF
jgi:hypothetical protein